MSYPSCPFSLGASGLQSTGCRIQGENAWWLPPAQPDPARPGVQLLRGDSELLDESPRRLWVSERAQQFPASIFPSSSKSMDLWRTPASSGRGPKDRAGSSDGGGRRCRFRWRDGQTRQHDFCGIQKRCRLASREPVFVLHFSGEEMTFYGSGRTATSERANR